jgi:DNA-binding MarR family transcriptional regulator
MNSNDEAQFVGSIGLRSCTPRAARRSRTNVSASYRLSGTLRPPAGLQLSPEELADVVARLAEAGPISNSDVRAATGLDRAEALAVLDRLVRAGRLVRTGQRRGAKYHRV